MVLEKRPKLGREKKREIILANDGQLATKKKVFS